MFLETFNPHPPLTAFPISLILLSCLIDIFSSILNKPDLRTFSERLFYLACLLTPLTYYSGYWGLEFVDASKNVPKELLESHQASALMALICLLVSLLLLSLSKTAEKNQLPQARPIRLGYSLFLAFTCAAIVWTGYLGGTLVFEYGAGVR